MRLTISRPAAWAAGFVAGAARVFYALAVEDGPVHNGVWLSALLGALLSAPLLALMDHLRRCKGGLKAALMALLCLAALADSGLVLSAILRSSAFLAMDQAPMAVLTLPVAVALFWCVIRNGDAVGFGAMLWMRIFPALMLVVALLQWRHYRPGWLLPLLGDGWEAIWSGGLRSACRFLPIAALPLVCEDPDESEGRGLPAIVLSTGAVLSALMLLPRLMMAPTALTDGGWLARLDTLLTNGRAPLYLQLPMIALWYAGLFHLLACEGLVAALLLQRLFPVLDGRLCALLMTLTAVGICNSPLCDGVVMAWLLPAVWVVAAVSLVTATKAKEGGRRACDA